MGSEMCIRDSIPRDLHWQYLAMTFVIATFLWWFRSGRGSRGADGYERKADFLTYLLPKDIYTHVSARVDAVSYTHLRAHET